MLTLPRKIVVTTHFHLPHAFVVMCSAAAINLLSLFALFLFLPSCLSISFRHHRPTAACASPTTITPSPPHPVTPPLKLVLLLVLSFLTPVLNLLSLFLFRLASLLLLPECLFLFSSLPSSSLTVFIVSTSFLYSFSFSFPSSTFPPHLPLLCHSSSPP